MPSLSQQVLVLVLALQVLTRASLVLARASLVLVLARASLVLAQARASLVRAQALLVRARVQRGSRQGRALPHERRTRAQGSILGTPQLQISTNASSAHHSREKPNR